MSRRAIDRHANRGEDRCRNVTFVWAIRDICECRLSTVIQIRISHPPTGQIEWISDVLFPISRDVPPTLDVDIRLIITGTNKQNGDTSLCDVESMPQIKTENKTILKLLDCPFARIQEGRPDLHTLIKNKIARAVGNVSVNGMVLSTASN